MGRVRYDEKKIARTKARLISNAGYVKPTAEAEDVAQMTVARWRDGKYPPHVDPVAVEAQTEQAMGELAEMYRTLARASAGKSLELVETIGSAKDAAIVSAIATDKAQLLMGKPTERTELVDLASFLRGSPSQRPQTGTNLPSSLPSTEERVPKHN